MGLDSPLRVKELNETDPNLFSLHRHWLVFTKAIIVIHFLVCEDLDDSRVAHF